MARHLAEFVARPLDAEADQQMPSWAAELAAALVGAACVAFTRGLDALAVTGLLVAVVLVLFPHVLGRQAPDEAATPGFLVWTTNIGLVVLVACAGLAIGLLVPPLALTLPLLAVVLLPLAVRVPGTLVRRLRRRPSRR